MCRNRGCSYAQDLKEGIAEMEAAVEKLREENQTRKENVIRFTWIIGSYVASVS